MTAWLPALVQAAAAFAGALSLSGCDPEQVTIVGYQDQRTQITEVVGP